MLSKKWFDQFFAISDHLWRKVFLDRFSFDDSCMKSWLNQIQSRFESLIPYLKTTSMTVLPTSCSNWCRYIPPPGYSLRKPEPCGTYQIWFTCLKWSCKNCKKQFTFLSLYVTKRRVVTIKEKYNFDVDNDFIPPTSQQLVELLLIIFCVSKEPPFNKIQLMFSN